jgi:hypothetical protein
VAHGRQGSGCNALRLLPGAAPRWNAPLLPLTSDAMLMWIAARATHLRRVQMIDGNCAAMLEKLAV